MSAADVREVREAVTLILRKVFHADTPDELEQIAREIARLEPNSAGQTIGTMAQRALEEK